MHILKKCDILGVFPSLNLKKNRKKETTIFGAIISILIIVVSILFLIFKLIIYIENKVPPAITTLTK